jgi:N-acetylglucosamine kinase-like BadF-type ATPase
VSEYVIGLDGGGTKTKVLVADRKKKILESFLAGAINYNGSEKELIDKNMQTIFQTVLEKGYASKDCVGICIGTAGISNPLVRQYIMSNLELFGYSCPVSIVGDHETALAGALLQVEGMILIAGTGSICYGKDEKGNSYRTGGYGHLIDDAGSGYAIGRDILSAVIRAHDKRCEATVLTKLVLEYLNIQTIEELIRYVYDPDHSKKDIARLSILIEEAYRQEDKAAIAIVDHCVSELMELTKPILRVMKEDCSIAVSGSILLKNQDIFDKLCAGMKKDYPLVTITKPMKDAAFGAVILATSLIC